VAGLRPGLGRGGTTHSLLVSDIGVDAVGAGGEVASWGWAGFMHSDGLRVRDGLKFVSVLGVLSTIAAGDPAFEDILDQVGNQSASIRVAPVGSDN
jgi:hypothetical protein